jgi:hypothetical protein
MTKVKDILTTVLVFGTMMSVIAGVMVLNVLHYTL